MFIRRTLLTVLMAATLAGCSDSDTNANGDTNTNGDTNGDTNTNGGSNGDANSSGDTNVMEPTDPADAPRTVIDRFSEDAGMLMVRTADNGLPEAGDPIDYDQGEPFITQGLGPDGEMVKYYNFDVQSTEPAPIYVLFREGEDAPVEDQLNVVDVVPGDPGYSDFWLVTKVTVPEDYVANTVTSLEAIEDADYTMEQTDMIVNCPIVPDGSTATLRYGDGKAGLTQGWYNEEVVYYFDFSEKALTAKSGMVPVSPIFVTFNINPGEDGGGPASGFVTEDGSDQTHNVVATLPDDAGYSPLWSVSPYDNADFENVTDLASIADATVLDEGVANVNCPIVEVEGN